MISIPCVQNVLVAALTPSRSYSAWVGALKLHDDFPLQALATMAVKFPVFWMSKHPMRASVTSMFCA
jgi:hypothetical protein